MNTIERIKVMQAFVDGKNIECLVHSEEKEEYVYLKHPVWNWSRFDYRIESNWYDNIPESGVLCWVGDSEIKILNILQAIKSYNKENIYPFAGVINWKYATPLTCKEIKTFLSACPN